MTTKEQVFPYNIVNYNSLFYLHELQKVNLQIALKTFAYEISIYIGQV